MSATLKRADPRGRRARAEHKPASVRSIFCGGASFRIAAKIQWAAGRVRDRGSYPNVSESVSKAPVILPVDGFIEWRSQAGDSLNRHAGPC
jgi:hypothetical protein